MPKHKIDKQKRYQRKLARRKMLKGLTRDSKSGYKRAK